MFGVVVHDGLSLKGGHYFSFVRRGARWVVCDDDRVSPASRSSALSQIAYLLFYVNQSPPSTDRHDIDVIPTDRERFPVAKPSYYDKVSDCMHV